MLHRKSYTSPIRNKFDQTDREVLESTPEAAVCSVSSADVAGLWSFNDIDNCADLIVITIGTAVDEAIPRSKNESFESRPVLAKK